MRLILFTFISFAIFSNVAYADTRARTINQHGQCLAQKGDNVALDDPIELHYKLKDLGKSAKTEKSPYETQADFEARMASNRQPTRVLAGEFRGTYLPETETFYFDSLSNLKMDYKARLFTGDKAEEGKALGRNGWGDTWAVYFTSQTILEIIDRPGIRYKARNGLQSSGYNPVVKDKYKLHNIPRQDIGRCGPYGCIDQIIKENASIGQEMGVNPVNRDYMYYRDGLKPEPTRLPGRTLRLPYVTLRLPKAEAEANHEQLKFAYVITPKGKMAESIGYTGTNEITSHQFHADIHCVMILDRNDDVIKVVPTTYGKTVYGAVQDNIAATGSYISPIASAGRRFGEVNRTGMTGRETSSKPSIRATTAPTSRSQDSSRTGIPETISDEDIKDLRAEVDDLIERHNRKPNHDSDKLIKMGFMVIELENISDINLSSARTGGLRVKADVQTSLINNKNMQVGMVEYGLIMFPKGNPSEAVIMQGYANGRGSTDSSVKLNDRRFEGVAGNPSYVSLNASDYEFYAVATEVRLTNGKSQRFINWSDIDLVLELLKSGQR